MKKDTLKETVKIPFMKAHVPLLEVCEIIKPNLFQCRAIKKQRTATIECDSSLSLTLVPGKRCSSECVLTDDGQHKVGNKGLGEKLVPLNSSKQSI